MVEADAVGELTFYYHIYLLKSTICYLSYRRQPYSLMQKSELMPKARTQTTN